VDDVEYATGLLRELGRVGIRLALDDFGTGYSSLAFLRRFSMDKIKIDKAFIHELGVSEQGTAIVRLVIDLAHALGMQACAEGVETAEHLARLRDMGCDEAQGFYFWKPLACEEVVALLADPPRKLLDHPYSSGYPLDPAEDGRQYFRPK
jgi:FOG: EAL domain